MVTLFSMPSARQVATTAFILLPLLAGQASAVVPNVCSGPMSGDITFNAIDTDYTWESTSCAPGASGIVLKADGTLNRVKIVLRNPNTNGGTITVDNSLILGDGSSITMSGVAGTNKIVFSGRTAHPTAAVVFSSISNTFASTIDFIGAVINTGSVSITGLTRDTATDPILSLDGTFTNAVVTVTDISVKSTAFINVGGAFTGGKLTFGKATGIASEYPLVFTATSRFTESELNVINSRFAATPSFTPSASFVNFVNTPMTFTNNNFLNGFVLNSGSSSEIVAGGPVIFRQNVFTQNTVSDPSLSVKIGSGGRIDHDGSNRHAGGGTIVVDTTDSKESEFTLQGYDQTVASITYTQTGCTGSDIKLREVTFTEANPIMISLIKTTGSKLLIEAVKADYIALIGDTPASSAVPPEPATGADIKIVNNYQIGSFKFISLHLDASTVTIYNNRFVAEVASQWFANVVPAVAVSSTAVIFERNTLFALSIEDVADSAATEIKLRSNTFTRTADDALFISTTGGAKVDHDVSNAYAGGSSVRFFSTKGNGNIIAFDNTASFEVIEIAEVQSANSDIQLRGLTAKTIGVDIAASTHCVVTVDSTTADSLTLGPLGFVIRDEFPASYATINVMNNENIAYFHTELLNLRDSKVTFFRNTFTAASIWSAGIFTRSKAFFSFNTFLSFTANELQQFGGSELKFRNNMFTLTDDQLYALYVKSTNGGRIDHDASNVYAGGKIEYDALRSETSNFVLEGTQTHGEITFTQNEGNNFTAIVRGVKSNGLTITLAGVLEPIVLVEGITTLNGGYVTINGDADKPVVKADIKIVKNYAVPQLKMLGLNLEQSIVTVTGNEMAGEESEVTVTNAKDTVILFETNRILALTLSSASSASSVFRFRRNAILRRGTVLNALNINLVDGGSIDHDASNKYYGGVVTVASIKALNNVFALDGIQSHGVFTYSETDSVASVVTLRSFTTSALTVTIANARNANVLIESTTSEGDLTLKGGLGLSTVDSTIKVIGNDADVLRTVDFNLAKSSLTFAKNIIMSTTEPASWALADLDFTCVTYESNSFQYGLLMADALVKEGSTVQLRNNNFWQTNKAIDALTANIVAGGRIDHDETNVYAGGKVSIASNGAKNTVFALNGERVMGAVTYVESSTGTNAYVAFTGFATDSLEVNLGVSVSSSALISNVVIDGALTTRMTRATGSYIAVQDSTLKGDITLAGSLKANSQYLVRNVKSESTVNFAATTDCLVGKPCRVEFDGNALSSVDAGSSLEITGSVGDNTLLSIVGNRLGRSATATAINLVSGNALTGSASLVIARNHVPSWSQIDRAISFGGAYTFTGSADVWGNVFVSGGIRLRLGATPTVVNVVKNRATFFLVYGADVSGGRVSACNILAGNDQETHVRGGGFKAEFCGEEISVNVCNGEKSQSVTAADLTCDGALVMRDTPRYAPACGALVAATSAQPIAKPAASATAAPVAPIVAPVDFSVAGDVSSPVAAADVNDRFTQSASSASVAASVALVAMVGAMMAL